jgi:glycerol-3-phosphate responsive antiterminator
MPDIFEWTNEEKACVTGQEQLEMLERLVDFVNVLHSEIESLKEAVQELQDNTPNP